MKRLILLLCLMGCSRSELINSPFREAIDTTYTRTEADSTGNRKEIGFEITIENWIEDGK